MTEAIPVRVVELLCSRLLHDLISPVAAVNNGVELIRETGEVDEALELVAGAGEQAARRIKAWRLAWGLAGADAPLRDARATATSLFETGKIKLDWPQTMESVDETRPGLAKLLLNAVLLAAESLPGSGAVFVRPGTGGVEIVAEGRAPKLKHDGAAALDGTLAPDAIDAVNVSAVYTARLAASYGFHLHAAADEQRLTLRLSAA